MNGITIYSKNKSGKILEWKAETDFKLNSDGWIPLNIYYGQQNGKIQHKVRFTKSGKNKNKVNATTIEEQAALDLQYLYRAQLEEKGYFKSISEYKKPRTAMLAHKYADKKHKLDLNDNNEFLHLYYAQPKLNGIRCTATKVSETEIVFTSRTNKVFTSFTHLSNELLPVLNIGDTVDGELFNPNMPLEYIASIVNSDSDRYVLNDNGTTLWNLTDIQYHLYDGIENEKDDIYADRKTWLDSLFKNNFKYLVNTITVVVTSIEEMQELFATWIAAGFEGLMLRDGNGLYEFNERSIFLLKYKEMFDEEFQIVDIIESENEPGQPVFIVNLRNDQTCNVRKSGDKNDNEKYLTNSKDYIDKWLTVQFQARTKYDNLSFPVGLYIRSGSFENGQFVPET